MTASIILNQIIQKGGIIGQCGNVWKNDKEKVKLFLKECSEMCHSPMAKELWGEELINNILRYTKNYRPVKKDSVPLVKKVGKAIRIIRDEKDIKQRVMAEAAYMSQSRLCKIEKGSDSLSLKQLDDIAKALNVSLDVLMFKALELND